MVSVAPPPKSPAPNHVARPYVVFKLRDEVEVPDGEWTFEAARSLGLEPAGALKEFAKLQVMPHFGPRAAEILQAVKRRAAKLKSDFPRRLNLNATMQVEVPSEAFGRRLVTALNDWPLVEFAYLHPGAVSPPAVNPGDDPLGVMQGYLDAAALGGIDARYAWTVPGGDGAGQSLVDIEWGWNLQHEDLREHAISLLWGENIKDLRHGTNVLGIIAAADNALHCIGITPKLARIAVVGQWKTPQDYVTGPAVLEALSAMVPGDVLLLEAQTILFGYENVPLEIEPAVFDLVHFATEHGIVVIAAAGNGGVDLDTVRDPNGEALFDRNYRDSGAILVGSAHAATRKRLSSSCYGDRVDCFAWGDQVVTLDSDNWGAYHDRTRADFSQTSAAAAIVAGAALAVQGAYYASTGNRLEPQAMRKLLSNSFNTPSVDPPHDRIGVMPDLRSIIQKGLGLGGNPEGPATGGNREARRGPPDRRDRRRPAGPRSGSSIGTRRGGKFE